MIDFMELLQRDLGAFRQKSSRGLQMIDSKDSDRRLPEAFARSLPEDSGTSFPIDLAKAFESLFQESSGGLRQDPLRHLQVTRLDCLRCALFFRAKGNFGLCIARWARAFPRAVYWVDKIVDERGNWGAMVRSV